MLCKFLCSDLSSRRGWEGVQERGAISGAMQIKHRTWLGSGFSAVHAVQIHGGGEGRGKNPYRLSIRSPMFITIPFVAETMIGYKVADIPAIMGSFDPCIGETDR